jgi:flavin reductase (DIM6/NTAB) family NADH-FMN oxidoreductase RutF
MNMIELGAGSAHRVMSPRVVFLLGTISPSGDIDCIPVCNVGVVSSSPEIVFVAAYKRWQSCANLLEADGFTLSVPRKSDLAIV